jgi:hypothetical protein
MSRPFEVQLEKAYERRALFGIELLDAVTLSRVSQGVKKVVAEGLKGEAIVNASGYFVWLDEDMGNLQKVTFDLGLLPYESIELAAADVQLPLTTIELQPRADYPFAAGTTGIRGTLIEERVIPPQVPVPVEDAEIGLRWLDDDDVTWRDSPTISRTNSDGDFVSILRLAPTEVPDLDADRKLTVRLRARRNANERTSSDLKLLQGRVADPSTLSALTFAWDELQP